jgi:hypothetical protein
VSLEDLQDLGLRVTRYVFVRNVELDDLLTF